MLTMARGLMMEPKLMLLDEPSMGLAPVIVEQIFEIIADLHPAGHHHPARGAECADGPANCAARLRHPDGRIALTDASERLQNDPVVQGLYLGEA